MGFFCFVLFFCVCVCVCVFGFFFVLFCFVFVFCFFVLFFFLPDSVVSFSSLHLVELIPFSRQMQVR